VWWKDDGGYLLFSDINNARRIKYAPGQGVSVFRENTNRANGLTRDMQGDVNCIPHQLVGNRIDLKFDVLTGIKSTDEAQAQDAARAESDSKGLKVAD